jgi:F-type H+-transporting ATPase subunit delta
MSTNTSFSTEASERYARALYEVGQDSSDLEKIEIDIKKFKSLYDNNIEIKNFIHNPTHVIEIQNKTLNIVSEQLGFSKNLRNFFLLLIRKRRIFFIKKIIDSFLRLCLKNRGEIKASLISSKELSPEELENISKELSSSMGSTIKFDYKVDDGLIGGLKLQLGSFMIDTSIKNKLKKYEQRMLEN